MSLLCKLCVDQVVEVLGQVGKVRIDEHHFGTRTVNFGGFPTPIG